MVTADVPQGLKPDLSGGSLSQRWKRCATQNRSGDGADDTRVPHFIRDDKRALRR